MRNRQFANGALALLAAALFSVAPARAETIRISGSGGPLASMRDFAAEFGKVRPEAQVVVMPALGSGGAIKAVMSGALQIGLSSRPLTAEEQRWRVVAVRYATTPFGFGVAARNRVPGLTLAEAAQIYEGKIATWPDGGQIRLVLRPESDSDTGALRQMSARMERALGAAHARKGMLVAASDHDAGDMIEGVPGAIGTITRVQIVLERRKIRMLPIDGVEPTLENLADGSYPFSKGLYLVTGAHPSRLTRDFVDFVLSPAGRKILRRTGQLEAGAAGAP